MRTDLYGSAARSAAGAEMRVTMAARAATVFTAALAAALLALAGTASAEPAALQGTWSGGGTIFYASGSSEGARCRARYTRIAGNTYDVTAACATASTRVDQSAQVRKVSANRYAGTFYNSQYGVTGRISIVVNGRSQTVLLQGSQASARFRLSR